MANLALGTIGPVEDVCGSGCKTTWRLGDGTVAMAFEWDQRTDATWSLVKAATSTPPVGSQVVTIGGIPALFARSGSARVPFGGTVLSGDRTVPGADEVLVWKLTSHWSASAGYSITAAIRGPNTAQLESQVISLMASLQYVDPIVPLPTDAGSRKQALEGYFRDLAEMTTGRETSCFPREPGATATAVITNTEVTARALSRPLAVRCTATIEPVPEQAWKVTLTYSWDAASDHPAGTATDIEVYLPGWGAAGIDTGFDTMPNAIPWTGSESTNP